MHTSSHPRSAFLAGVALAVLLASPRPASADGGPFGLGVVLGTPTGASAKLYLDEATAVDAAVGMSVLGGVGVHAHVDFLWHPLIPVQEASFDIALYLGIGGRILEHDDGNDDDIRVGVRVPFGVLADIGKTGVPLDIFLEIAPIADLVIGDDDHDDRRIEPGLNLGLGVRYYF